MYSLLSDPLVYIEAFCEALKEESKRLEEENAGREGKNPRVASSITEAPRQQWFVGFTPNLGPSHHVSPRGLTTQLLRTLVVVEGIVTKCTTPCPPEMGMGMGMGMQRDSAFFRLTGSPSVIVTVRFFGSTESGAQRPLLPAHRGGALPQLP